MSYVSFRVCGSITCAPSHQVHRCPKISVRIFVITSACMDKIDPLIFLVMYIYDGELHILMSWFSNFDVSKEIKKHSEIRRSDLSWPPSSSYLLNNLMAMTEKRDR